MTLQNIGFPDWHGKDYVLEMLDTGNTYTGKFGSAVPLGNSGYNAKHT